MSNPYVAEIRIFAGNFAPTGWALCDGQIMPISQNTALFSLLGTTYGGDGQTTFALPDLRGRAPLHQGQGTGLSLRSPGDSGGSEGVTLLEAEMPFHSHFQVGSLEEGDRPVPAGRYPGRGSNLYGAAISPGAMDSGTIGSTGSSQSHNNLQPYLVLNFIIALQGVFPPRG